MSNKKLTKKQKAEMLNNAILIAEGAMEPTATMSYVQAWQHLVDTGMAWELQGWFHRAAVRMIAEGTLDPAPISQESENKNDEQ